MALILHGRYFECENPANASDDVEPTCGFRQLYSVFVAVGSLSRHPGDLGVFHADEDVFRLDVGVDNFAHVVKI